MRILPLLLTSLTLFASEDILNLAEDLNDASNITAKTKLNINNSPAIVSVLHSSELQKLGITDVFGALETVPGIEVSMGIAGSKQINMRGNKSLVTDKLKFMIDGVSINAELSGSNSFYLNMPIENVERIEIIRGPASTLYGSFAHIGVINIITKLASKKRNTLFVRGSSARLNTTGFTQHIDGESVQVALSGSLIDNSKQREYTNYSLLPGQTFESYEDFRDKSLAMKVDLFNDFSIVSRYLEHTTQNYYGYGAWPIASDPKELVHTSLINEFLYAPTLAHNLKLEFKLGYKTYQMKGQSRLVPYSLYSPNLYDLVGDGDYKEHTYYTDIALHYEFSSHKLIVGTYLSQTAVDHTQYFLSDKTVSETPTNPVSGGGLKDDIERKQYALYLNDIYTINDAFTLNLGGRYDHFSDADASFNPKLSLLYGYDEKQSYKFMYQHSFRAPSFVELYGSEKPFIGSEDLKSETIDTYELAFRYQSSFESWFGINFFYSDMQDFIYRDTNFNLRNGKDTSSYGAELEFKTPLNERATLQANYSYIYNEDQDDEAVPLIANHLANLMFSYKISSHWHAGTKVRYVGKRAREEGDSRDDLDAYTTFDQTITYSLKAFTLQATLKNIFDADVRYPAPVGNNSTTGTYLDDLEQDGPVVWLSAKWNFR